MQKKYEKKYFSGEESFFYGIGGGYKNYPNYWKKFRNLILRFKKNGDLLDIGCAYGFLLKQMKKEFKCYGSDISNYAIKKAKTFVKDAVIKVNDICESFPFKKKFEVITMIDTLEHIQCPKKALKDSYKHLKKDGILIIKTPHLSKFRKIFFKKWDIEEGHISMYNINDLIRNLKECGFKIVGYYLALTDFKLYFFKSQIKLKKYKEKINKSLPTESIIVARK